jgi:hypothetical protein
MNIFIKTKLNLLLAGEVGLINVIHCINRMKDIPVFSTDREKALENNLNSFLDESC